ncbi:MAG TPA: glycosyltransferase family A protein [Prolixibacteraceae bacterium]|jgi:hypothetical protein
MKFALATVIFPGNKEFFLEFVQSLRNQTDQNFILLIVNDGCNLDDFDLSGFERIILSSGGSITKNREILIHEAFKLNSEWIVFADADDWFDANRIEVIRTLAPDYDLIANEIVPFNGKQFSDPRFEKILGKFSKIDLNFILDKNLFGLSNVACRTQFLKDIVIPPQIIAVDWFIFTKAIQANARACFTANTKTYYRQWADNIIGIDKTSEKAIKTGVKAKYFHYKNLEDFDVRFAQNLTWLQNLIENIENSSFDNYLNKVRKSNVPTTFWWENIKDYEDV